MFPVICTIGPFSIFSYGLMLAVAVFTCSYLLARDPRTSRAGIGKEQVYDLVFWVVISGILGARIFFILLNWQFFMEDPKEIVMIQHGGLAWQGGLILGSFAGGLFLKKNKLSLWTTFDLAAPYLALGQAIGRIGCFLNGCCYGREVSSGVYFPVHEARLYPTQLFDAAGLFMIFLFLKYYSIKVNTAGKVFVMYLWLAPALRFGVEFYRADHEPLWLGLSIFQFVCLAIILSGTYGNAYLNRHPRGK